LGNVMSVINGHKIPVEENGEIDHYTAQIEAAYDYSPFGVLTRQMENPLISEGGTTNTLEADFRWCFDGDATEMNGTGHDGTVYGATVGNDRFNEPSAYEMDGDSDYIKI